MKKNKIVLIGLILVFACSLQAQDTLRVLCIGNSFLWDAVEQELVPIGQAVNQPIIIGNLLLWGR